MVVTTVRTMSCTFSSSSTSRMRGRVRARAERALRADHLPLEQRRRRVDPEALLVRCGRLAEASTAVLTDQGVVASHAAAPLRMGGVESLLAVEAAHLV